MGRGLIWAAGQGGPLGGRGWKSRCLTLLCRKRVTLSGG